MVRTRYLVIATLLVAAAIIASSAPQGPSVLEITASLNEHGVTAHELDTFLTLAAHSSIAFDQAGRRTIVAPNDQAFDTYFSQTGTSLDEIIADQKEVDRVVLSHIIRGRRASSQLQQAKTLRTEARTSLHVESGVISSDSRSARIVRPDAYAANGVVHVISGVLS